MHVRQRYVRCGFKRCRCTAGDLHGPYWYGFYRDLPGAPLRSIFIGRELPPDHSSAAAIRIARRWVIAPEWSLDDPEPEQVAAALRKALRVLGVRHPSEADAAFRRLQKLYHPDRSSSWPPGVTREEAEAAIRAINGAREYLFERWR